VGRITPAARAAWHASGRLCGGGVGRPPPVVRAPGRARRRVPSFSGSAGGLDEGALAGGLPPLAGAALGALSPLLMGAVQPLAGAVPTLAGAAPPLGAMAPPLACTPPLGALAGAPPLGALAGAVPPLGALAGAVPPLGALPLPLGQEALPRLPRHLINWGTGGFAVRVTGYGERV
jgi:hypothetical protein